ncbi:MAG: hypothetical protein NDJ94_14720 [Vicinamibacteria bacterium]|nr:hypothetical protein [Vicinamibacteria bacterium]
MARSLFALILAALAAAPGATAAEPLTVTASFTEGWVPRDEPLGLVLSRPLQPGEGTLVVTIGVTDVSSLFRGSDATLVYDPLVPLPPGEHELVVQLAPPEGAWTEVARLPLKVLTRRGFRVARTTPTVAAGLKAQFAEDHRPEDNRPPRTTFEDLTLQARLETEHSRGGGVVRSQWGLVGASYEAERLRFAQQGKDAPPVDLAGYAVTLERGRASFTLGDVVTHRQRFLLENFASRGTQLRLGVGARVDLTLAALAGSQVVGWDNFLGVTEADHRVLVGTLGLEVLARAGGLRVEGNAIDGRVATQPGFNQAVVNDVAESRGAGLRVQASTASQKLRFEGGYAWSTYVNPQDPLLAGGQRLVPVAEESRQARYALATVAPLQNRLVTPARAANLSFTWQHDRADPLYASVGAVAARGDLVQDVFGAQASLGEVTLQLSHTRAHDNLDALPSILRTLTRRELGTLSLPLSALRRAATPAWWLPVLTYNLDRTHQFGAALPTNADFAVSHVPDQATLNQVGAATWNGQRLTVSYRYSRVRQDNRQPGRQNADFLHSAHGGSLMLLTQPTLMLGLDLSFERAESQESGRVDRLQRAGLNFDWRARPSLGLTAIVSLADGEDEAGTAESRNLELDANAYWLFSPRGEQRRPQARVFLRVATQRARQTDLALGFDDDRRGWQLGGGITVNAF